MLDWFGSLESLLQSFGYLALFGMVFAESGLFFGFFLPGDSLLFTAGLLSHNGFFPFWLIWVGCVLCAIAGDQVGYWTGQKFGKRFFNQPGSFFRNPAHIEKAERFFEKHGKKTIVLARFVPAVRTFAPIVAGTAKMDYSSFLLYNVLGGLLWCTVFLGAGYWIGSLLPDSGELISIVILGIIVLSLIPIGLEVWKSRSVARH